MNYNCTMKQEQIDSIRAFNRYYTKILGVLNKHYLGSEFGLPEVRVIQDIYLHPKRASKEIASELGMDKGFLSRLLKQLEQKQYILKKNSEEDSRVTMMELTEKGHELYQRLNAAAERSVEEMFAGIPEKNLQELIRNMNAIHDMIHNKETNRTIQVNEPLIVRPVEEEDNAALARVLRASVEEHGAPKVGTFYDDPHTDRIYQTYQQKNAEYWVVECHGKVSGGGGFYPTKGLPEGYAELTKFHFLPELRGKGVGKYLLRKIEERAAKAGYTHLYIVSYHEFGKAVGMYEKCGYVHINHALDESGLYQGAPFHMVKELKTE